MRRGRWKAAVCHCSVDELWLGCSRPLPPPINHAEKPSRINPLAWYHYSFSCRVPSHFPLNFNDATSVRHRLPPPLLRSEGTGLASPTSFVTALSPFQHKPRLALRAALLCFQFIPFLLPKRGNRSVVGQSSPYLPSARCACLPPAHTLHFLCFSHRTLPILHGLT